MDLSKTPTIFFICNDPERALGLEILIPNFHIVCIDDNPIVDFIKAKDGKIFCLERAIGKKNSIFRNSNKLLLNPEVQKYIEDNTPEGEAPKVMFFKIASNIEKTCKNFNYWILNTTSELNKKFETKISQFNELKDSAVNFPKTIVGILGDLGYEQLVEELGEKFVIQYARGHTGSSTVFVDSKEVFEKEKSLYPKREARIARKVEGEAWTINACATRFGIFYGGLSYQITGVPELTDKAGGTVGNDWSYSSKLSEFSLDQISTITERVGKAMRKQDFRGLFGLDLIIDENGEVFLIEVNARQPASTSMHTKLMIESGLIPLQIFHMAEFLFENDKQYLDFLESVYEKVRLKEFSDLDFRNEQDVFKYKDFANRTAIKPIQAAQVFLRNINSESLIIKGSFMPGVYKYADDLIPVREGYGVDSIQNPDEFQILAQEVGLSVSAGSELARIQAKIGVIDGNGNLESWVLESLLKVKSVLA